MSSVAILLVGTGTIAGIIKASTNKDFILQGNYNNSNNSNSS